MSILQKTWSNRKEFTDGYIGSFISTGVISFINLYCAAFKVTQSQIIRKAMMKWMSGENLKESTLLDKIASNIQEVWFQRKMKDSKSKPDFSLFKEEAKKELEQRKLTENQINIILKKLTK